MRSRRWIKFWCCVLFLSGVSVLFTGCGSGGGNDSGKADSSGALGLTVNWPDSQSHGGSNTPSAILDCQGIDEVAVQVFGPDNTLLATNPGKWSCDQRQGSISGIRATNGCTVVVLAKNSAGEVEYQGMQEGVNIVADDTARVVIDANSLVPQYECPPSSPPANDITCQWSPVAGAADYELRISTDSNMGSYNTQITTETSIAPVNLASGVTYFWQVVARDRFGNASRGLTPCEFSILLGSPTLISPGRNTAVLPGSITFSWQGPAQDLSYHISIANEPNTNNPLVDIDLDPEQTTYQYSGLVDGQTYYWQVAALDSEGQTGIPSEWFQFICSQDTLSLNGPANGSMLPGENLRLNWEFVPHPANRYRVTVARYDTPETWVDRTTTTDTYYDPTGIEAGTRYIWRVEALDANGALTHMSSQWEFTTMDDDLILTAPDDNITRVLGSFDCQWQPAVNDGGYRIVIASDAQLSNILVSDLVSDGNSYSLTDHPSLSHGSTYYWRVYARDSNGEFLDNHASGIRSFNTLGIPSLVFPHQNALVDNGGFNCEWNPVQGADRYRIVVSTDSNPLSNPLIVDTETQPAQQNIGQGSLEGAQVYYWQVMAIDDIGNQGLASDIYSFTTMIGTPEGVAAVPGHRKVTINYNPVIRADDYNIYWNTSGSVDIDDNAIIVATAPQIHTGLQNRQTYFYKVEANNATGPGSLSSEVSAMPGLEHVTASDRHKKWSPNATDTGRFGHSVAISGDYAIVGAYQEGAGAGNAVVEAGAAYIYHRTSGNQWDAGIRITAPAADIVADANFGFSVDIDGDYAVVGATGVDAVYVFNRIGLNAWDGGTKLTVPSPANFGGAVAISRDHVIVGDSSVSIELQPSQFVTVGAAYIFNRTGTNQWGSGFKIMADDNQRCCGSFGNAVDISSDYAIVGDVMGGGSDTVFGAAYVFQLTGTNTWSNWHRLMQPAPVSGSGYGHSVAIDGDYAIVANSQNGTYTVGDAYVFHRTSGNVWDTGVSLAFPSLNLQAGDQFGFSVDISGDYAVIGAQTMSGGADGTLTKAGSAFIFYRSGVNQWSGGTRFGALEGETYARFGCSIGVSGDSVIVGARHDDGDDNNPTSNSGAVYIY